MLSIHPRPPLMRTSEHAQGLIAEILHDEPAPGRAAADVAEVLVQRFAQRAVLLADRPRDLARRAHGDAGLQAGISRGHHETAPGAIDLRPHRAAFEVV